MTGIQIPEKAMNDRCVDEWERQQKELAAKRKIKLWMPEGLQDKTFDTFRCDTEKQTKILEQCKRASEKIKNGEFLTLCMLGTYGIGKTHLASAICNDCITNATKILSGYEIGFTVRFVLCDDLIEQYDRAKSFTAKMSKSELIDFYTDLDLLIMDEAGRSTNQALETEVIYRIVNGRTLKKKSSVFTSNMKFNEFAAHLGSATMDRLKESAVFLDFEGMTSQRGRK